MSVPDLTYKFRTEFHSTQSDTPVEPSKVILTHSKYRDKIWQILPTLNAYLSKTGAIHVEAQARQQLRTGEPSETYYYISGVIKNVDTASLSEQKVEEYTQCVAKITHDREMIKGLPQCLKSLGVKDPSSWMSTTGWQ